MQFRMDLLHGFRTEGMRADAGVARRGKPADGEWRFSLQAGIDEEDQLPSCKIKCMLDLELKVGQALDIGQAWRIDMLDKERSERVVAARRIAPAKDQDPFAHGHE